MSTTPEHPVEHPAERPGDVRPDPSSEAATPRRQPLVVGHLVMGVAFLGLAVVWLLVVTGTVEGGDIRFLLPVPWVLAGAAGLVGLVVTDRRRTTR